MFSAYVGHSEEADADAAVEEILEQCRAGLDGAVPRAGLLFAAIDFDHQALLCEITRAFPEMALIGCTTDGEISSELGFREDSATLILFVSDTIDITSGVGRGVSTDAAQACRSAVEAAQAKTDKPARLCLATPEGLTIDGHLVTATLQHAVGPDIPMFGALAGDQWRLKGTKQFYGTEVLTDAIPVLLLSGDFHFSYGVATGWHQVGEVGRVTKAAGSVVHDDVEQDDVRRVLFDRAQGRFAVDGDAQAVFVPQGLHEHIDVRLGVVDHQDSGLRQVFHDCLSRPVGLSSLRWQRQWARPRCSCVGARQGKRRTAMRGAALAMPIGIAYYFAGPIDKASRPDSPQPAGVYHRNGAEPVLLIPIPRLTFPTGCYS